MDLNIGVTYWLHEGLSLVVPIDSQCIKAQGIDRKKELPYRSPFGAAGTWFALVFCILIAIFKISSIGVHADVFERV
jgi:amino acid permease